MLASDVHFEMLLESDDKHLQFNDFKFAIFSALDIDLVNDKKPLKVLRTRIIRFCEA